MGVTKRNFVTDASVVIGAFNRHVTVACNGGYIQLGRTWNERIVNVSFV